MASVRLNARQTRTLKRIFKKIDIEEIGFLSDEAGEVVVIATDTSGWTATATLSDNGNITSWKLDPKDEAALINAGVISDEGTEPMT